MGCSDMLLVFWLCHVIGQKPECFAVNIYKKTDDATRKRDKIITNYYKQNYSKKI